MLLYYHTTILLYYYYYYCYCCHEVGRPVSFGKTGSQVARTDSVHLCLRRTRSANDKQALQPTFSYQNLLFLWGPYKGHIRV